MSTGEPVKDFSNKILKEEWKNYLSKRRQSEPSDWRDRLTGLAISGGGIRSAAFSLGVLQRLAAEKVLSLFDYLSTVSGGGYTGGSISYFLNCEDINQPPGKYDLGKNFPYGDPDKSWHSPTQELDYLRSHGNYLAPGHCISLRSFVGVVLRAVLLNLIIWLPVLWMVMAVAQRLVVAAPSQSTLNLQWYRALSFPWFTDSLALSALGISALFFVTGGLIARWMKTEGRKSVIAVLKKVRIVNWLVFFLGAWFFACRVVTTSRGLMAWPAGTAADTWLQAVQNLVADLPAFRGQTVPGLFMLFEVGAALLLAFYVLLILIYSLSTVFQKDRTEYLQRRWHACLYGSLLKWLLVLVVLASLPYLSEIATNVGGIGALLVGLSMGLWKLYQRGKEWISIETLAPVASLLVFYGLFITAYFYAGGLVSSQPHWLVYGLWLAAILLGYWVNLNHISVGRYYRDRLMEAFMPSKDMVEKNENGSALAANTFTVGDLATNMRTPYHLVNTNAVLVDSMKKKIRKRGGDSFVFSPLYVGSQATGWRPTDQYSDNAFTLATAVATSAAAINPHAGPAGTGLSRNSAVSLLMAMLNLRLGYWAPNPRYANGPRRMHHLWSAWYELMPKSGYREDSTFVQLSDGGHFDNLGLYELFRRRVRFILVLDGGADKDFQFSDLQNALHRAEQDFMVHLNFDDHSLGDLIPQEQKAVKFPDGLKLAETGYISGRFDYGPEDQLPRGWFFYIKTTLTGDMSMRIRGYKGAHPDFPDETTADQFFDEDQFDAYRLLGIEIAEKLTNDSNFTNWLNAYHGDEPIR
ncbi:MAG: hypothetical protein HKO68_10180 [Desulfobacterales bacterium]|nr:hypothetical protein [Desulfobacterales bacterium]